jgi:glycerol-3-phosphate acyltransferase PlsY
MDDPKIPYEVIYTLAGLLTYFVGAIPFGFLTAKWVKGVDIRETGSRNIGATNAARALGRKWFPVIFTLDFMKGFAPVFWLAPIVWGKWTCPTCPYGEALILIFCGLMAMGGHMWPVYLKFKGGKGVATGAGVIFAINWQAGLIAISIWLAVFLLFRYVSLASIAGAIAMAVGQAITGPHGALGDKSMPVTVFCAIMAVVVVVKHRDNIRRLMKGEESRVSFRGKK